jgi:hypothetical protein
MEAQLHGAKPPKTCEISTFLTPNFECLKKEIYIRVTQPNALNAHFLIMKLTMKKRKDCMLDL